MPSKLKYSIIMFIAGSSYGIVIPLVRTSYSLGFETPEVMFAQYFVAVVAIAVVCLLFSRKRVSLKDAAKLMGVGLVAAGVSFFYYHSLQLLPPAASLTLLFQFVWMGMIVQAVRTRTLPKLNSLIAVVLVVIGAVFATGMLDQGMGSAGLDPLGVLFGMLAAACYTAFLTLSSMAATQVPTTNRTLFTTLGSLFVAVALCIPLGASTPLFVVDPVLGIAIGIGGICVPVFLINLSSPKLPTGLTTIMASSELPSGVICAALFLGEAITPMVGIGVIVILVGIVVSELDTIVELVKKKPSPETPPIE